MNASHFTYCPLCGNTAPRQLKDWERAHLSQCPACKFTFARLIPSQDDLIRHYQKYGRNDFLSSITIKRYHELLDLFEPYKKTGRLLDVGCGIGYFLIEAKKRGWNVYGTEFTPEAIEICRSKGIHMYEGVLNSANYEPESFDIITSFEVIEHINTPHAEITNFSSVLRTGGLVYLTTPNFNSLSRLLAGKKWNIVSYPEHLSYYTPHTLSFLFRKHGFKKLCLRTTGISISRIKISRKIKTNKPVSKNSDDEKIRQLAEHKWYMHFLKTSINYMLTLIGKGDTIKGIFIKTGN